MKARLLHRASPVLVLLAVAAWPTSARLQDADPAAGDGERLEGTWRLAVPRERAEQVVDRAVDRAVDAMPFFVRPIARDRLRDGTPVTRVIELRFHEDGRITVEFDGRAYTTRVGRTEVRTRASDGERLRVTQRWRPNGRLEQVFQSDGGTRWYVYRPTGPDRMRMESTTNSDRMPQPMRFALDYRRR